MKTSVLLASVLATLASADMRPAIIAPKPHRGEPVYTTTIPKVYETLCPTGISTATTHITTELPATFKPSSIRVVMTSKVTDCTMCGPHSTKVTLSVPHETYVPGTGTGLGHKTHLSHSKLPVATGAPPVSSGTVPVGTGGIPRASSSIIPHHPVGHNSSSLLATGTGPVPHSPTGTRPWVSISTYGPFPHTGTGSHPSGTAPPSGLPTWLTLSSHGAPTPDVTMTVVRTEVVTMTKPAEATTTETSTITVTTHVPQPCSGLPQVHARNWLWK